MVEQQPRLEFAFDATQGKSVSGASPLPRNSSKNFLAVLMPAEPFVFVGPGRGTLVPENDDSVAAIVKQVFDGRCALIQQLLLVVHRDDVERNRHSRFGGKQVGDSPTEMEFESIAPTLNEQPDFGH